MDKPIIKKNVHLSQKEKQYVARLIEDGGTLAEISEWHKTRFGKPIARSKYFRLKSQAKSILADKLEKSRNNYTRKGENDLQIFESRLKDFRFAKPSRGVKSTLIDSILWIQKLWNL